MLQREIVREKEANWQISEFKKICIREYVAAIRERDPAKCWPFGSISEFKNINNQNKAPASEFLEPSTLINLNVADNNNVSELPEDENFKGKEVEFEAPTEFEVEVSKRKKAGSKTVTASLETSNGNETPLETATVFQLEWTNGNNSPTESDTTTGKTSKRTKKRKLCLRLLSELLKDLAGPNVEPCVHFADKVHEDSDESDKDITIDGEDDSDDDTLDMFLRKRKRVKIASGPRHYKKKKKARKPRPSNPRPKGSKARIKRAKPHDKFVTRKRNRALDVVEADMAVAAAKRKKLGPNDMRGGTGRFVLGQSVAGGCGMVVGMPGQRLTVVCVLNQNPADFTIPGQKKHMIRF